MLRGALSVEELVWHYLPSSFSEPPDSESLDESLEEEDPLLSLDDLVTTFLVLLVFVFFLVFPLADHYNH